MAPRLLTEMLRAWRLRKGFRDRRPWVTQFLIHGRAYGGTFAAHSDPRVPWFFEHFPAARSILELGSLEGGHTFGLAQRPEVVRVVGIEGRRHNVEKARFVQAVLGIENVEFVIADLESSDLTPYGAFDAVFCSGVLYHLPRPWTLVERIARITRRVFVWTHYADPREADQVVEGYAGKLYREGGLADPLSGLSPTSFWPTYDSLLDMFRRHGFVSVRIIQDNPAHPYGPCVTFAAVAASDPASPGSSGPT